jgi:class 3 adenylate cyclase
MVFSGGDTEGEDTIKGEPVNLAARLESAAEPGTVLISHDSYKHVRGGSRPMEPPDGRFDHGRYPDTAVYLFLDRYFIRGLLAESVKG